MPLLEDRAQTTTPTEPTREPTEFTIRVLGDGGPAARPPRRGLAAALVAVAGIALAVALVVVLGLLTGLLSFGNPFAEHTVDRTPPVVLHRLRSLSTFQAARATFEVNVDLEHDHGIVPRFIAGDRETFSAVGSVDATVDFRKVTASQLVSADGGRRVELWLPAPRIEHASVDARRSHVTNRDRGLLDRIGGVFVDEPTSDRPLVLAAERKMDAAASRTALVARAEQSTTTMLRTLLGRLGYKDVVVRFRPLADASSVYRGSARTES